MGVKEVIKVSIIWDGKNFNNLNSDEALQEIKNLICVYQQEIASTSISGNIFIGLATGEDTTLLQLLNQPEEIRSLLLKYIRLISSNNNEIVTVDTKINSLKEILLVDLETPAHQDPADLMTLDIVTGVPGKALLQYAGTINQADLVTISHSIETGCERADLNEW